MKPNDEEGTSFESIDARLYTFPARRPRIDSPEDRIPFLAAIFGLPRPMLIAMTNNPMIPETWRAPIDSAAVDTGCDHEGGGGWGGDVAGLLRLPILKANALVFRPKRGDTNEKLCRPQWEFYRVSQLKLITLALSIARARASFRSSS